MAYTRKLRPANGGWGNGAKGRKFGTPYGQTLNMALAGRVKRLEQNIVHEEGASWACHDKNYEPSEEELAEAIQVLIECGVIRLFSKHL